MKTPKGLEWVDEIMQPKFGYISGRSTPSGNFSAYNRLWSAVRDLGQVKGRQLVEGVDAYLRRAETDPRKTRRIEALESELRRIAAERNTPHVMRKRIEKLLADES